ncbi:MAG: tetratricopeptide repeat protein [Alphaproteobacteria bacterium]|nr:tetratricopeptide repeat protein [Alphaproteobacteria bacterium]
MIKPVFRRASPKGRAVRRAGIALAMLGALAACAQLSAPRGWADGWIGGRDDVWGRGLSEQPQLLGSYLAARYAAATRDSENAARYYGLALSIEPDSPVLLERKFLFDLAEGSVPSAVRAAPSILEADPDNPYAQLVLALDALRSRDYGRTLANLNLDAQGPFGRLSAALVGAWAELGRGDEAAAIAELDSLGDLQTVRIFERFHRGLLADLTGNAEDADAAYKEAILFGQGRSLRMIEAYGSFLARQGREDEAFELYTDYLELAPDNPIILAAIADLEAGRAPAPIVTDPRAGAAEALYGIASVFPSIASVELPLIYLNLAVYLRPDFDVALALIGDRFEDAQQWERAVEVYRRIERDSPLAETISVQIAYNLDRLDRTDEAVELLREKTARNPDFYRGPIAIADILRARERYGEALSAYDAALSRVDAQDGDFWALHYARGTVLERLKRWPEAEESLLTALEMRPEDPLILNYLGYSWVDQGLHLDRALAMIERAVELRPDDGYIVDSLGWAHYRLGNYDRAVRYLERAVELAPGDPTINDHLGDAFWRVGRKLEARFQWSHVLDMDPEPELAARVRRKLELGLDLVGDEHADYSSGTQ